MDLFRYGDELRKQFEISQVEFLLTELDTATTFCNVAKSAREPEKIERNIAHAREGYDTAMHFSRGAHFDPHSKNEFDQKLDVLKSLLRELGQQV